MVTRLYERKYGSSYFHQPQPLGRCFIPGKIGGYYNDLTAKADFAGPTNAAGAPLVERRGRAAVALPVSAAQMALGLYDRWLLGQNPRDQERFLAIATYLLDSGQSRDAGAVWPYPIDMPLYGLRGPFISAMGQGQVASVMVRAAQLTGREEFLSRARAAIHPLSVPVIHGGVGAATTHGWWLEEYPTTLPSLVLNGCIFAAWGAYDLALAGDAPARELFAEVARSIARMLSCFDVGGWSRYDRYPFAMPNLASPFYHRLHVAQLEAMARLTEEPVFTAYANRWRGTAGSEWSSSAAIVHKTAFRFGIAARDRLRRADRSGGRLGAVPRQGEEAWS